MASIKLTNLQKGIVGIVGHAGCGHANSHLGFIQDDSGGLSAVVRLLQKATGADLTITEVLVQTGTENASFEVRTACGGVGKGFARRGITQAEKRLSQYVIGKPAINSQALAMEAFGRMLGQGAMEVPVAFQTAIANASLTSFKNAFPDSFSLAEEDLPGNCGKLLATVVTIDDIPVSVLGVVNATIGGLGPNEDIEGNVNLYGKKDIMAKYGLDELPTFIGEGKVCALPFSGEIDKPTFLIRGNEEDDNPIAANALVKAAAKLGLPAGHRPKFLKRSDTAMKDLTYEMGQKVIELGKRLASAATAAEKVEISAELNLYCSTELGGITFMGNEVHKVMGGVGQIPGTSAVMSLFIPVSQQKKDVIPSLSLEDVDNYVSLMCQGVKELVPDLEKAQAVLAEVKKRYGL